MGDYCVVVAGGTAARVFTLEPADIPELQSGPNLVQRAALPGPKAPGPAQQHTITQDTQQTAKQFARELAAAIDQSTCRKKLRQLVLCADSRLLSVLRSALDETLGLQVTVHAVPKDLAKLSSREVHEKLSYSGHLPRRRRAAH